RAQLYRADAGVGRCDQHDAEAGGKRCEADALPLAARAIVARLHAEVRLLVEAGDRAVARVEYRVRNAAAVLQRGFHRLDAIGVLIPARRDAKGLLEAPLQVKRAHIHRLRELAQRYPLAAPRVEIGLCL